MSLGAAPSTLARLREAAAARVLDVQGLRRARQELCSRQFLLDVETQATRADAAWQADYRRIASSLRNEWADAARRRAIGAKLVELIGVTGGAGLFVASIAAALAMGGRAWVSLLPAAGGLMTAYAGSSWYALLTIEQGLYDDLTKGIERVIEKLP
ncbi:MAG: hypothetical protein K2X74_19785 [Acetobacteraceae bacterium]|nr:hypothetical protein [Acetobacteraceae bacterium]